MTLKPSDPLAFMAGPGEMAGLTRAFDWSGTTLGPPATWPAELKVIASVLFASPQPMVVWWGPELVQLYNDAFRALLGSEKHPYALGQPARACWAEIWPLVDVEVDRVMRAAAAESRLVPLLRDGRREASWWSYSLTPLRSDGAVGGLLGIVTDVTGQQIAAEEIRRRNAELKAEGERQRRMFDQAPGFIGMLRGPDHVFDLANQAYLKLLGARGDVIGRPFREAFPDLEGQHFVDLLDRVFSSSEPFVGSEVPVSVPGPEGSPTEERLVDFIYQPILDAEGRTAGVFVEGSDVTDRVRLQKRQSLLIRELHHRVRNTLATVQGIMGATARSSDSIAEFRDAFAGRIAAMAKTHALLTEHHWQKASLRELLRLELDPFDDDGGRRVMLDGPDVELPSGMAVPIGMAIHEMTTNAVKHGSLSRNGGSVDVRWTVTAVPGGQQLTWHWLERGGPRVMPPEREGFGTRLLQRVLAVQTKAEVRIDFDEIGLKVVIILIVPDEEEPPS